MYDSWAILNAKSLFNDKNIKVEQTTSVWPSNTIYIVQNDKGAMKMLCSCGAFDKVKVGHQHATHEDQSGRNMGRVTVVNIVTSEERKIVKSENDIGLNKSMPIYVFK
jgi:hypothetical protein